MVAAPPALTDVLEKADSLGPQGTPVTTPEVAEAAHWVPIRSVSGFPSGTARLYYTADNPTRFDNMSETTTAEPHGNRTLPVEDRETDVLYSEAT
jgi:hypothetical protein